jgi:hypothetical protein
VFNGGCHPKLKHLLLVCERIVAYETRLSEAMRFAGLEPIVRNGLGDPATRANVQLIVGPGHLH